MVYVADSMVGQNSEVPLPVNSSISLNRVSVLFVLHAPPVLFRRPCLATQFDNGSTTVEGMNRTKRILMILLVPVAYCVVPSDSTP